MKTLGLAFTLIITLFISSCQVKEKSSDGGLISDHVPTTNKFTLQTPTAKAYDEGETITFTVTFPFDIIMDTTGGDPRLRIVVGATTRYADYDISPNARTMTFKYTVVAGENDTNGIDVSALELNGSTLKFDNNGTITDCAIATVTAKNFPNVKVDTAGPTITALSLTNLPGNYHANAKLNILMTFNEPVYVAGSTPSFRVYFHAAAQAAPQTQYGDFQYVSGSGTDKLVFEYTIPTTLLDTDGFSSISSPLVIGAGTLRDANGNDATLTFAGLTAAVNTYSVAVKVWGQYPKFVGMTVPTDKTYVAGETLEFVVEFDRDVNLTGAPYLGITIGSTVRQAQYVSGTGTELLTFQYTLVPGDVDADGITVPTTFTQNAGNIRDVISPNQSFFVNVPNSTMVIPSTTGIRANAIQPQAISVARNVDPSNSVFPTVAVDNKFIIGDILNVTVNFNTPITVTQTSGTPSIGLVIGSTTVQAPYLSGDGQSSLIFRYIIQEGDLDTDGTVALGTISLNGGVLTDATGTNVLLTLPAGLTTTTVDGVRPTISSVTAPANGTYSNVNLATMNFVVNWSEAVNYSATGTGAAYIPMNVGGSTVNLQYAANNNSAAITHRPVTNGLSTYTDTDGVTTSSPILGTAVIKDAGGNTATFVTFTPPTTTGVLVDTTAPTVLSVTAITADGTYNVGDTLDFSVTFSEAVTTNISGGYPQIPLTVGVTPRTLVPTSSTTNTVHTFRYTIVATDLDTDGVALGNAVASNGAGYARDAGQNLVTGTFTPPTTTGIKVDTVAPAAPTVSQTITNGTYETGDSLEIRLTYAETVTVDTAGGTPRIALTMDSGTVYLNYSSTVGGNTLVFNHTLTGTEYDFTGLTTAVASYALNGGTVQDDGLNNAPTTFASQDFSSVFVVFQNTKLWVRSNFVTKAKTGSPAVSNGGAITTQACGTGTCRIFNGDDSLSMGGTALSNVETVFIVFVTPATLNPHNIFNTDIALNNNGISFDIDTSSAALNLDGSTYASNTSHNTNMGTNTVHILQVDFDSAQNFGAGSTLIGTTFDGQIGEVMAVSGTLTNAQKTAIRNYLNGAY